MPASVAPINQSKSYVFLSHNSKDSSIVQTIAKQLESRGVNTWIDTEHVGGGEQYEQKITAAMRQAKVNIVFYGTHGLGPWQEREKDYASKLDVENGIHAIVVLLPNANEAEALKNIGFLATKSHIAFKTETDQSAMVRLLNALQTIINVLPTGSNPTRSSRDLTSELSSDWGVNYTQLEELLKAGEWEKADEETADLMREVMGRQTRSGPMMYLNEEDIEKFPCTDLRTIDQLWVKYSKGKFGFSVQKKIYLDCGAKPNGKYPGDKIFNKFCDRVGWLFGEYGESKELTFDTSANPGHLPFAHPYNCRRELTNTPPFLNLFFNTMPSPEELIKYSWRLGLSLILSRKDL